MPLAHRVDTDPSADLTALCNWCNEVALDPLRFVQEGYPWGEPGELERHPGPDDVQIAFLKELGESVRARAFDGFEPVKPIREAVSSGHGIGKSVVVAWYAASRTWPASA